mmetsp:Transcript_8176/g.13204  ORF Transcript_8176/g.13204 Transcript_8176/m.13204 type:complete len:732 (+) Transcript_8176:190-2385(+)|eukprot:CAMPEP_0203797606 /NCGR_PEP_ID=MMETSP0100_2-20121128/8740_1 /ASSEMBLY_ACC=CAM_ASM_000210 /TAXON_ID=96639 /ORGANISM=" , Strain NY0313808BC1" /LENGTH=731 /DNA_ID=CAMNT_0050702967 /DNA_START=76 /DNA_END=2271 /DNA_ORIENTATION=-
MDTFFKDVWATISGSEGSGRASRRRSSARPYRGVVMLSYEKSSCEAYTRELIKELESQDLRCLQLDTANARPGSWESDWVREVSKAGCVVCVLSKAYATCANCCMQFNISNAKRFLVAFDSKEDILRTPLNEFNGALLMQLRQSAVPVLDRRQFSVKVIRDRVCEAMGIPTIANQSRKSRSSRRKSDTMSTKVVAVPPPKLMETYERFTDTGESIPAVRFNLHVNTVPLDIDTVGGTVVAFDIGSSMCRVGVCRDGLVQVLHNSSGARMVPSYVSMDQTGTLVPSSPDCSGEKICLADIRQCLYSEGTSEVLIGGKMHKLEHILSVLFRALTKIAGDSLGVIPDTAVVVVPAHYGHFQRQKIIDAASIAGITVSSLLAQSYAVGVSLCRAQSNGARNVLSFSLGGGTMEVSVLLITGTEEVRVLGVGGSPLLGGREIDRRVLKFVTTKVLNTQGIDLTHPETQAHLLVLCERAKKRLSAKPVAQIKLVGYHDKSTGKRHEDIVSVEIKVTEFDELCLDIYKKCIQTIGSVISTSGLSCGDISQVVLSGGSTRIPRLRKMIRETLPNSLVRPNQNPDEEIILGASIHAGMVCDPPQLVVNPDTPTTLTFPSCLGYGVQVEGGTIAWVISPNTPTPCKRTAEVTSKGDQPRVLIKVYEGLCEESASKNRHLGMFVVEGQQRVELEFDLDMDCALKIYIRPGAGGGTPRCAVSLVPDSIYDSYFSSPNLQITKC